MKHTRTFLLTFAVIGWLIVPLQAHEGHDHAPVPGQGAAVGTGPIVLTNEAVRNLKIESVEAKLMPLQSGISMSAQIRALPEKEAKVSARFEGRVLEILVKLGEAVSQGQPLLKLDPVAIGNPPVTLRSPINGYVTRLNLSIGQGFTTETVLLEVADYSRVLARGESYENPELQKIQVGQEARVTLDAYPGKVFRGEIQRKDIGLEAESRTFEVYALLDNPELQLRPYMLATLSVGIGDTTELLAVPSRAVLGELGGYFVFVREGNTFERRNVMLGVRSGDLVEILEGVLPGEQVVVTGNYQLQYANPTAPAKPTAVSEDHSHNKWWLLIGLLIVALIGFLLLRRRSTFRRF